jgi:hypothetical protein
VAGGRRIETNELGLPAIGDRRNRQFGRRELVAVGNLEGSIASAANNFEMAGGACT